MSIRACTPSAIHFSLDLCDDILIIVFRKLSVRDEWHILMINDSVVSEADSNVKLMIPNVIPVRFPKANQASQLPSQ
ncbi:hypothetical protein CVT25_015148 [Psilocybe cyanescens]|uniref:Uncharacterized protein n=1 Tax=Psilocybe cyanescens TaxID=93625 RepID=A0A409WUK4_PSICY|nr:hypothetical protein CVT25_015148 [Psilocybe cyanescens]